MRIAILGTGKIGESLLAGLRSSDWADIVASSRRQERADELHERHGVETTTSNAEAIRGADVVVLAVKPQDIETLLGEVGHLLTPDQTVLSIAAAIPTTRIERHLAGDVPVVRAMPNTPATVHEGIAGMCAGRHAGPEHMERAGTVLRAVGDVVEVPEEQMDAITAVSGSGPAYYALLAEAMIEAGILLGLSREVSTRLVVQTMLGTAKLLRDEHVHPVELRETVTSPGGTTIRAIRELEQAGVRAAFLNAINAAMERSKELGSALAAWGYGGQSIFLTGGSVIDRAYEKAAEIPDWSSSSVWWGDERCVPPDDERSNYLLAKRSLLDHLDDQPEIHRMRGELDPAEAAEAYEAELEGVEIELLLLGMGPDGHVASLFPGSPQLRVRDRRVTSGPAGLEPFVERVTLTLPALLSAQETWLLITGEPKAEMA